MWLQRFIRCVTMVIKVVDYSKIERQVGKGWIFLRVL